MRTSSRSSSEAASSLRLVKMSVDAARDGRRRAREAQAQALKPALLRRRSAGGDARRGWGLGRRLDNAARLRCGRRAAAHRRAQSPPRRRRTSGAQAGFRLLLVFVRRHKPSSRPPYARRGRCWHTTSPHDAGRNKSAAPLSRRADARPRQARRRRRSRRAERRREPRGRFRRAALRPAAQARARPPARPRHRGLPGARTASQGPGEIGAPVQAGQDRQDLLGDRRGRARGRRGNDRPAARPAR